MSKTDVQYKSYLLISLKAGIFYGAWAGCVSLCKHPWQVALVTTLFSGLFFGICFKLIARFMRE